MMTIWQYVDSQKPMTCAQWVKKIKADNLSAFESQILTVADSLGLIVVNQSADFIKSINI